MFKKGRTNNTDKQILFFFYSKKRAQFQLYTINEDRILQRIIPTMSTKTTTPDQPNVKTSTGHRAYMEAAIVQAHLSKPVDSAYCVGCIVVPANSAENHDNGAALITTPLATGFSRELPGNTHAEESALMKMKEAKVDASGTDMYTTMEPCSKRLSGNEPCVKHIIEANIGRVFIGAREPDHFVKCEGVDILRAAGIEVYDVKYDGVRKDCLKPNQHIAKFRE